MAKQISFLREMLLADGYVPFRAPEIGLPKYITDDQATLIKQAQGLSVDRTSKGNRFRCYHKAIYTPWNDQMIFLPASTDIATGEKYFPFRQGSENPEFANRVRRFQPMPEAMQRNPALRQLVKADFLLSPFANCRDEAFALRFHVIRHTVEPGEQAASSPDLLHTDDVAYSVIHIIERSGVNGGVNCVAAHEHAGKRWDEVPIRDVLAQLTFTGLFSGLAFLDDRVSHYVSPIEAAANVPGARAVVIIDIARIQESKNM